MSNLISCNLMGGLGNQMFQASHAYSQSLLHNREVVLPSYSDTKLQGRDVKNYKDNIFRNFKFIDNTKGFQKVDERTWSFSGVYPTDEDTTFTGYYQSSKNFLGYDKEIKEIFSPTDNFLNSICLKYPELKYPNTLSIHIRKGDYIKNPSIHPTVGLSYVENAINLINGYTHVFIFSDDKFWIQQNLNLPSCTVVEEEDYVEMWMMSLCSNNIISNSTFSWWGSFLNKNENKKVIAPSIWFGPAGPKLYRDIYEPYWTILNVKNIRGELVYAS